jgi:hypothetical protein
MSCRAGCAANPVPGKSGLLNTLHQYGLSFFGHIIPCQVLPEAVTVQPETIIKEVVFSKGHKLANVDYEELLLLAAYRPGNPTLPLRPGRLPWPPSPPSVSPTSHLGHCQVRPADPSPAPGPNPAAEAWQAALAPAGPAAAHRPCPTSGPSPPCRGGRPAPHPAPWRSTPVGPLRRHEGPPAGPPGVPVPHAARPRPTACGAPEQAS